MKFAVDKIEEDLIVCENLSTKEKIIIKKSEISGNVHEGSIIIKNKTEYKIDSQEEQNRRKLIQDKLNRLKKNI